MTALNPTWRTLDPAERERRVAVAPPRLKRAMDIAAALLALALVTPVLVACALWIALLDGRPVLYRQWRVGRDGWLFRLYKLRTMRRDAERPGVARFACADDDRVIPGCRWMRRSHLDELPQVLNVLLGHMSLVGPRPERPEVYDQLRHQLPALRDRLAVTPGLTGLAQLRSGYANDLRGTRRKLAYDLRYARSQSLRNDLRLILATFPRFWDRSAL